MLFFFDICVVLLCLCCIFVVMWFFCLGCCWSLVCFECFVMGLVLWLGRWVFFLLGMVFFFVVFLLVLCCWCWLLGFCGGGFLVGDVFFGWFWFVDFDVGVLVWGGRVVGCLMWWCFLFGWFLVVFLFFFLFRLSKGVCCGCGVWLGWLFFSLGVFLVVFWCF